jgi:hypothetical protein
MSEVEDYQRVELLPIDEVAVAGHAVADVVHLLAELIENATSFSPPGTQVQIAGQQAAGGYVLEIEDRGLGMSDEELLEANQRLANPPAIDFAVARVLGLYVVGRLAQRHGIRVQLRHSWYGGVTALALLPSSLVTGPQSDWRPVRTEQARALSAPELAEDLPARDLPVSEQVVSDWFESGNPGGAHLPLRRHAPQSGPQPALPVPPVPPVPPGPVVTEPPAPQPQPVELERLEQPTQEQQAPPPAGLPRRVPRGNLAPGISERWPSTPPAGPTRTPEQIRAMLSTYRSGLERGRRMAADQPRENGNGHGYLGPAGPQPFDDLDGMGER